ncbi:peptidoglycan bridge formation glycyltransferase FemA/FemB family protein [Candidatus Gracilibacteria bacterium]|nr:peptidoglycan bridge formation glycyltransferase FemA/FemB family protein [Candidatus Gracilibacteria bacterium]
MNFFLQKITATQLNNFYNNFAGEKTFVQTAKYGDFREKLGEKNFRFGVFFGDQLVGIVQLQKIKARRGTYLHIPHGPLINLRHQDPALTFFLQEYKKLGRQEKCDFIRISPLVSPKKKNLFKQQKFLAAPVHLVNPELTWVLDLKPNKEELIENMKKSTRYEVRRIEKVGLKIKQGNSKQDLDVFWQLHEETVKRQNFIPFAKETTKKELEIFGNDLQIFSSHIDNKPYSSSIIIFDNHAAYYHQGASIYSKLPVSHATLWTAILEAKKRGCTEFNFWGICAENNKKHPWYGLSRFKRGFGGEEREFMHARDYPLTPKYWLNWLIEKWRKWKRNY